MMCKARSSTADATDSAGDKNEPGKSDEAGRHASKQAEVQHTKHFILRVWYFMHRLTKSTPSDLLFVLRKHMSHVQFFLGSSWRWREGSVICSRDRDCRGQIFHTRSHSPIFIFPEAEACRFVINRSHCVAHAFAWPRLRKQYTFRMRCSLSTT